MQREQQVVEVPTEKPKERLYNNVVNVHVLRRLLRGKIPPQNAKKTIH